MAGITDLNDPRTRSRLAKQLVTNARSRAKKSGLEFELDASVVEQMFETQGNKCAVSGVAFSMATHAGAFVRHPYGPSIDRVSSAQGYTRDNIRLVCVATNFGLGQWGDEVLLVIARGVVEGAKPSEIAGDQVALLEERLEAAEAILPALTEMERRRQRRRIAALRRALTLGPEGLTKAAQRAWETRRRKS